MATLESEAMKRMVKAKVALIIEQRFFGALAMRLKLVEDPTCKTMWTDGVSIGFNPVWVMAITINEVKAVICHEVMHVAMGHHVRRGNRDLDDWNISTDHAINPIIVNAKMTLPPGMLLDRDLSDKSAEEIYSIVHGKNKQEQEKQKQEDKKEDEDGDNSDSNDERGDSEGDGEGNEGGDSQADGNGDGEGEGSGEGECDGKDGQSGKGSGNGNSQTGKGCTTGGGCGEVRDYPGPDGTGATEAQKQQNQQDWQIAVASAAQASEGCGQFGGNLKELVKDLMDPKVCWKSALQRFVDRVSQEDYSYVRTNQRYSGFGVIMPGLYNKTLPPIDIWVDTSDSISTEDKKQFVSEINDIRQHYHTTIRIIYCDTDVCHVETVEEHDEFTEMTTYGGGGTDFAPAIQWSKDQEEQPCCGIYLTDMDCSSYGTEPDFPVLWIDTRGSRWTGEPPFGEIIHMHPKEY